MTFLQRLAVTMATAVLRVATGVCVRDVEGGSEDKRWGGERIKTRKDASEKSGQK